MGITTMATGAVPYRAGCMAGVSTATHVGVTTAGAITEKVGTITREGEGITEKAGTITSGLILFMHTTSGTIAMGDTATIVTTIMQAIATIATSGAVAKGIATYGIAKGLLP